MRATKRRRPTPGNASPPQVFALYIEPTESVDQPGGFGYRALVSRLDFKTLFCAHFRCPDSEYELRAFRKCLYPRARLLAPIIHKLNPDLFAEDFNFIQYLGATTGVREANEELQAFEDVNRDKPGLFRTGLRLRVSGRKAVRLAHQLFSEARHQGE